MVGGVGAVFALIALISFFEALVLLGIGFDLSVFNPIRNYNQWRKINWFGVIVATILLNVFFPLYAIAYWIYIYCLLLGVNNLYVFYSKGW